MRNTTRFWAVLIALTALAFVGLAACQAPPPPCYKCPDLVLGARERIAIDARNDSYLYQGADLYVYSDDHSTQKLHIDGATGNLDAEGTGNFAGIVTLQAGFVGSSTGSFASELTASNGITVGGAITVGNSVLTVSSAGAIAGADALDIDGATTLNGTLDVDGATTLNGALDVDGNLSSGTGLITVTTGLYAAQDLEHQMFATVASEAITYSTSGALWTVADGEVWIVHDVLIDVGTNFDCTGSDCTLQIGDGNDANGLLDLVDAEMQAADTEGTGWAAGWQGQLAATKGAYLVDGNFVYAPSGAAETIDITIGGTDPAAGAATVYIIYTRIL
jgi:hypothetical protein